MANNRFRSSRFGQKNGGTYICTCCGKRTRETGQDESSVELCAACYWDGQIDILMWDRKMPADQIDGWMARRAAAKPNTPEADTKALEALWCEMAKATN